MSGAAQRAADVHGRGGGETPVQWIVLHHLPVAMHVAQAYHASAMCVDFLANFFCRPLAVSCPGGAGRVQSCRVDVLEVNGQQAIIRAAIDGEEMHAVMVHAHGVGLVDSGIAAVRLPGRGFPVEWCSPGGQDACTIALGNGARIGA